MAWRPAGSCAAASSWAAAPAVGPSFIAIGNLAQVNQCPRCGTANELARAQWRDPVEEPSWYYDLHPVARELLADHGEVPLLLSRHLRSGSRRYDDVPELELRDDSGNPVAEADLIAVGDDEVIVAEAKSNDALGRNPREVSAQPRSGSSWPTAPRRPDNPRHHATRVERFKHHGNPQRGHRHTWPAGCGRPSASSPASAATTSRTCGSISLPKPTEAWRRRRSRRKSR